MSHQPKSKLAVHYDQLSSEYEDRWSAYNAVQRDWIMVHLPEARPHSILELGCGQGKMLARLGGVYPNAELTGVDASAGMLGFAKTGKLIQGDLEDNTFTASVAPADLVLSMSVLHHLTDPVGHLNLIKSKIYAGGTAFVSAFARDGLAMNAASVWFRLTQSIHQTTWSLGEMYEHLNKTFPDAHIQSKILRPDVFWRIQIFSIRT